MNILLTETQLKSLLKLSLLNEADNGKEREKEMLKRQKEIRKIFDDDWALMGGDAIAPKDLGLSDPDNPQPEDDIPITFEDYCEKHGITSGNPKKFLLARVLNNLHKEYDVYLKSKKIRHNKGERDLAIRPRGKNETEDQRRQYTGMHQIANRKSPEARDFEAKRQAGIEKRIAADKDIKSQLSNVSGTIENDEKWNHIKKFCDEHNIRYDESGNIYIYIVSHAPRKDKEQFKKFLLGTLKNYPGYERYRLLYQYFPKDTFINISNPDIEEIGENNWFLHLLYNKENPNWTIKTKSEINETLISDPRNGENVSVHGNNPIDWLKYSSLMKAKGDKYSDEADNVLKGKLDKNALKDNLNLLHKGIKAHKIAKNAENIFIKKMN